MGSHWTCLSLSFQIQSREKLKNYLKNVVDPCRRAFIGPACLSRSQCLCWGRLLSHNDLVDVVDQEDQELMRILNIDSTMTFVIFNG